MEAAMQRAVEAGDTEDLMRLLSGLVTFDADGVRSDHPDDGGGGGGGGGGADQPAGDTAGPADGAGSGSGSGGGGGDGGGGSGSLADTAAPAGPPEEEETDVEALSRLFPECDADMLAATLAASGDDADTAAQSLADLRAAGGLSGAATRGEVEPPPVVDVDAFNAALGAWTSAFPALGAPSPGKGGGGTPRRRGASRLAAAAAALPPPAAEAAATAGAAPLLARLRAEKLAAAVPWASAREVEAALGAAAGHVGAAEELLLRRHPKPRGWDERVAAEAAAAAATAAAARKAAAAAASAGRRAADAAAAAAARAAAAADAGAGRVADGVMAVLVGLCLDGDGGGGSGPPPPPPSSATTRAIAGGRADAEALARSRNRLFEAALAAARRGDGRAAKRLSAEAHALNAAMRDAHAAAAAAAFGAHNPPGARAVDLHGLYVAEALDRLAVVLAVLAAAAEVRGADPASTSVKVLTGAGHHSGGGGARLLPAVRTRLRATGVPFVEVLDVNGDVGGVRVFYLRRRK
ncbi:hypothetical protein I4F81_001675 [Pyropia yezoensis]|uniref:Uncharacterized protein n=1 Tax=Pyropia yezoensis TaxID=2788 RepID=A0ACC3BNJ9_PYRYE|nr:hypothetical protein I4F81_001675 [Neopyropia yezoensis]